MNRIKEVRKNAGIKQIDLCARLGISQGTLSGWENGKYEPDTEGWVNLSRVFGCSVGYLMGVEEEAKKQPTATISDELQRLIDDFSALDRRGRETVLHTIAEQRRLISAHSAAVVQDIGQTMGAAVQDFTARGVKK